MDETEGGRRAPHVDTLGSADCALRRYNYGRGCGLEAERFGILDRGPSSSPDRNPACERP